MLKKLDASIRFPGHQDYLLPWEQLYPEQMINEHDIKDMAEFPQPAMKYDGAKPRMDLLDPEALEGLAKVLTFGAQKYSANNWRGGFDYSRNISALMRHLSAIQRGEDIDPESGLPHIDHIGCNWMFLSFFMKHPELYEKHDDRWKAPNAT